MTHITRNLLATLCCCASIGAFAAPSSSASHAVDRTSTATRPTQSAMATPQSTTTQTTPSTTTRAPAQTGQPSKSCEDLGNRPGGSMSAPGSAFNPDGKAGSVYAGEQPQNSRNTASVSQYDVACARPSR